MQYSIVYAHTRIIGFTPSDGLRDVIKPGMGPSDHDSRVDGGASNTIVTRRMSCVEA